MIHNVKKMNGKRFAPAMIAMLGYAWFAASTTPSALAGNAEPRQSVVNPGRAVFDPVRHVPGFIVVKFHDDSPIRLRNGSLTDFGAGLFDEAHPIPQHFAGLRWTRVTSVNEDRLDELRETAQQYHGRAIPNLNTYFYLKLPPDADPDATLDAFNDLEAVEFAIPIPIAVPATTATTNVPRIMTTPDLERKQGYLNDAPFGIGARFAWEVLDTRGEGVKIMDIERTFNAYHDDFPDVSSIGPDPEPGQDDDHGTAVLGMLGSLDNGWGTTGIAHGSDFFFGVSFTDFQPNYYVNSILDGADALEPGDVILIEVQVKGPKYNDDGTQFGMLPVEWHGLAYGAILYAIGNEINVIVPAGNGFQNLHDSVNAPGDQEHSPFENDSGAIYVGAGAAPAEYGGTFVARSRLCYSNYGERVNVQGWGERVWTTGYGDAICTDKPCGSLCCEYDGEGYTNLLYTGCFGGTSSASPIVAGAAALLQSAFKQKFDTFIPSSVLRQVLITTGSPQQNGASSADVYPIGPLPNIAAAAVALGSADPPVPTIGFSPTSLNAIVGEGENPPARQLFISNTGGASLSYTISTNVAWLTVTPDSGESDGEENEHWASFSTASMPVGQYSATITIMCAHAVNSPQTVPVNLTIQPAACDPGLIMDCNGNCAPSAWLGNGTCTAGGHWYQGAYINFCCAELDYDGGDCVADCNGNCAPSAWLGDDTCTAGGNWYQGAYINFCCAELDYDGGDCVADCNGNCAPSAWLGDNTCTAGGNWYQRAYINFCCAELDYDGGDCVADCNGNCAPNAWQGDGTCAAGGNWYQRAYINFCCAELNYDDGDCVGDCNGNCAPSAWLGDGTCASGSHWYQVAYIDLNCAELDCDHGDCGTSCPFAQQVLAVSPSLRSVGASAGATSFTVSVSGADSIAWSAAVQAGVSWLSVTSGSSGVDGGIIVVGFDANPDAGPRTGAIRVSAPGAAPGFVDVSVVQAGTAGVGLVAGPSQQFESSGLEGGPFAPVEKAYTLRNSGTVPINWTATRGNPALFQLSQTGGTLPVGASTMVTVSLNTSEAAGLAPGEYTDTIAFSNLTNGLGNTTRLARLTVIDTYPIPDQDDPERRVSLDHLWEWNEGLGRFAPPGPAGILIDPDQPTYLLTHGWDGTLDGVGVGTPCNPPPKYAMSSIGCAIRERVPNANLIAWDWADIANPNNKCDLPDELVAAAGGGEPSFSEFAQFVLLGGVYVLDQVQDAATAPAAIVKDAQLSGIAAGYEGNKLGLALANEIREHGSLGSELHLIGKSHGGGVLGFAAVVLRDRGFAPDSLTTLDTPKLCAPPICAPFFGCTSEICIVNSLSNVALYAGSGLGRTAVFYYPDLTGGGFGKPVLTAYTNIELNPALVPDFDPFDPFNPQWIDHLWISGLDEEECVSADGWYPQAVRSAGVRFGPNPPLGSILDIEQYAIGCFFEGSLFQFAQGACPPGALARAEDVVPASGLSLIAYEPFRTVDTWSGTLAQLQTGVDPEDASNRAVILREQGNASFFKDIAWPSDAAEITFDYLFLAPRGMESLTVYLGEEIVYYDNADVTLATEALTSSGPIYVGNVAGTTARLNFVLRTDEPEGGELAGAVVLDNLRVYGLRPGDIDFDGDRDLFDLIVFQQCFRNDTPSAACAYFDFNGDGVVDLLDFLGDPSAAITDGFVDLFDGPQIPPIP